MRPPAATLALALSAAPPGAPLGGDPGEPCRTACCRHGRDALRHAAAQALVDAGGGRTLGSLVREYRLVARRAALLDHLGRTRRDWARALGRARGAPEGGPADAGDLAAMERMALADAVAEEGMDDPVGLLADVPVGAGGVLPALRARLCPRPFGGRRPLCRILSRERPGRERRALAAAAARLLNGHRSLGALSPREHRDSFGEYKGILNHRVPPGLAGSSEKAGLARAARRGGAGALVPGGAAGGPGAACLRARALARGASGNRARRGALRSLARAHCRPGPAPGEEEGALLEGLLEELRGRIRAAAGSPEHLGLEALRRGALEARDAACGPAGREGAREAPGWPPCGAPSPAPGPALPSRALALDLGRILLLAAPGSTGLAALLERPARELREDDFGRLAEAEGPAGPAADAGAPGEAPPRPPRPPTDDDGGPRSLETVLTRISNDHGSHPFYRLLLETSRGNTLKSLHFDSHDRESWSLKERVRTLPIDSFEETVAYEKFKINVFEFVPEPGFSQDEGGFFTFRYLNSFRLLFNKYKEVRLGIVRRGGGDWILVDGDGRRVTRMHVIAGRMGISDIFLERLD